MAKRKFLSKRSLTRMEKSLRESLRYIKLTDTVRRGDLDLLKRLISKGYVLEESLYSIAAYNGHLHILEWLRDESIHTTICPWDEKTCSYAAQGGHLHILKWLRDSSIHKEVCPLDERSSCIASYFEHLHVVEWLKDSTTD